jgi:hypothetical protein
MSSPSSRHCGWIASNTSTLTIPACVRVSTTGAVEPSVSNSSSPRGPRPSRSTMAVCRDALADADLLDDTAQLAERTPERLGSCALYLSTHKR